MSDEIFIALISLVAAMSGAIFTQGIQWLREYIDRKRVERREREQKIVGFLNALDMYVADIAIRIRNNEISENTGGMLASGTLELQPLPSKEFNLCSVNLRAEEYSAFLELTVLHKIFQFEIAQINFETSGDAQFEIVNPRLKRMGNAARSLSESIRRSMNLPIPKYDSEYLSISRELSEKDKGT